MLGFALAPPPRGPQGGRDGRTDGGELAPGRARQRRRRCLADRMHGGLVGWQLNAVLWRVA